MNIVNHVNNNYRFIGVSKQILSPKTGNIVFQQDIFLARPLKKN